MNLSYTASYKQFLSSLKWNSVEATYGQILLTIHQITLFKTIDSCTFGLMSVIFSTLYLTIHLLDFGLDVSLSPFFNEITATKKTFKRFILVHIAPQIMALCLVAIVGYAIISAMPLYFTRLHTLSMPLYALLGALLISEGVKKIARTLLQLAFYTRLIAYTEIFFITSYISSFWLLYSIGIPVTLHLILAPMLLFSCISCFMLLLGVYVLYASLPAPESQNNTPINNVLIAKTRALNYINQVSKSFFSGNFLIPFFALHFGLQQASVFKIISIICRCISIILNHTFGYSSEAYFSHIKKMSAQTKSDSFALITQKLYHTLLAIGILFFINHKKMFLLLHEPNNAVNWHAVYLFLFISFSENLFLTYERFLITEHRSDFLLFSNLMSLILLYAALSFSGCYSESFLFILIMAVRLVNFAALTIFAFYQWNITPSYKVNYPFLSITVIISWLLSFLI